MSCDQCKARRQEILCNKGKPCSQCVLIGQGKVCSYSEQMNLDGHGVAHLFNGPGLELAANAPIAPAVPGPEVGVAVPAASAAPIDPLHRA
jgi:hypothetical protein